MVGVLAICHIQFLINEKTNSCSIFKNSGKNRNIHKNAREVTRIINSIMPRDWGLVGVKMKSPVG